MPDFYRSPRRREPPSKVRTGEKDDRNVVVVDVNGAGNSGYSPLRGKPGADRTKIRDTYVKHYYEIADRNGNPVNPNNPNFSHSGRKSFSPDEVRAVRKELFETSKQKERNVAKYKDFHKDDKTALKKAPQKRGAMLKASNKPPSLTSKVSRKPPTVKTQKRTSTSRIGARGKTKGGKK